MNCKAIVATMLLLTGAYSALFAQNGLPKSFADTAVLAMPIPIKTLPPVPQKRTLAKALEERSAFRKSLEVGTSVSVQLNLASEGRIDTIDNVKVIRMSVKSEGAQSVGMKVKLLDARNLGNTTIFVYTPNRDFVAEMVGEMTADYATLLPFVPGDEAVVEVNQPIRSKANLEILEVVHSEVPLVQKASMLKNTSQSCNFDVACSIASGWYFEKNAVVKICTSVDRNIRLCSGTLVNNTSRNKRPYLLTANHCISTNEEAKNSVFYFGYERPVCGSGVVPSNKTISGATLVSTGQLEGTSDANLDFTLLELSTDVPEDYDPYFAGWDIRQNPIEKPLAVCIHHPSGDVKKISISNHLPIVGDYISECEEYASYDRDSHWHVEKWDNGVTEGGSSGSPLFNDSHSIIGTLTGGYSYCDSPYNDYYSMISAAWDRYSDKSNQLKHWLDPQNVGDSVCTGMTYTELPVFVTLSKNNPCVGDKITMKVVTSLPEFTISGIGADNLDSVSESGTYDVVWSTSGIKNATFSISNSVVGELMIASVSDNPEKPVIERDGRNLSVNSSDMCTWYVDNISSGNGYSATIDVPGSYKVQAINAYGCSSTSDAISFSFADRPYSDSLIVYPVPVTNGKVKVKTNSFIEGKLTVNIFSLRGSLIGTTSFVDPSDVFEVELPLAARNGVYVLEFYTKKGKASKKILVL